MAGIIRLIFDINVEYLYHLFSGKSVNPGPGVTPIKVLARRWLDLGLNYQMVIGMRKNERRVAILLPRILRQQFRILQQIGY